MVHPPDRSPALRGLERLEHPPRPRTIPDIRCPGDGVRASATDASRHVAAARRLGSYVRYGAAWPVAIMTSEKSRPSGIVIRARKRPYLSSLVAVNVTSVPGGSSEAA